MTMSDPKPLTPEEERDVRRWADDRYSDAPPPDSSDTLDTEGLLTGKDGAA